jgi:hypothetical protein
MRRLLLSIAVLLSAACGTVRGPAPESPAAVPPSTNTETAEQGDARRAKAARPTYNLAGYPPAVRDGYIDGCESAKRSSYARKDVARMASDDQYSMGWNDGFSICKKP